MSSHSREALTATIHKAVNGTAREFTLWVATPSPSQVSSTCANRLATFMGHDAGGIGKGRICTWDALHGEIEGFDRFGRHCGVFDPLDGREIKPAIKGRRIDV